jgi:hypothetical protein
MHLQVENNKLFKGNENEKSKQRISTNNEINSY